MRAGGSGEGGGHGWPLTFKFDRETCFFLKFDGRHETI